MARKYNRIILANVVNKFPAELIEVKYITSKAFADSLDTTDIKRKYLKRYFE